MGRHGQPPPPREVPWGVLAWGGFATATAAALVWWTSLRWTAAVFVAVTGLVSTVLLAVLTVAASGRPAVRKGPPHEPDRSPGPRARD